MVKKLGILGFILVVVSAAGMVWAGINPGDVAAPSPAVMPAAAPPCAIGAAPAPAACMPVAPAKVKCAPKKLKTTIKVKMKYPKPATLADFQRPCGPPPIPVAVPMWKFIVPWPPFVYYLPVE